ncbi:hypothetical protein [Paraburkholderia sp. BR14320]|uniref:hypothetical protein n=1 Tax=unclassified Paraburkholderia TaxID=2615204 RepID=UPI0034CD69DE
MQFEQQLGCIDGFFGRRQFVALDVFGERNTARFDVVDVLYDNGRREWKRCISIAKNGLGKRLSGRISSSAMTVKRPGAFRR